MKMSVDQTFRKARSLSRSGEPGAAEQLYKDILARFPGNRRASEELQALLTPKMENPPQAELDELVALYGQGRFADARTRAQALLAAYPHGEILHNLAGVIHYALGDMGAAVVHYDEAIGLAPDYFEALNNRGNALRALGRDREALADLDEAIRLKPDYANAHVNRGVTLGRLGRVPDALDSLAMAIRLQPGLAQAHSTRATLLRHSGRLEEALGAIDMALRLAPAAADAHRTRASILQAMHRLDAALDSFTRAGELSPLRAADLHAMATMLRRLRRLDEARTCLETALDMGASDPMVLSDLVYLDAQMCHWSAPGRRAALKKRALAGTPLPSFHILTIDDDPALQLVYARSLVAAAAALPRHDFTDHRPSTDGRIRIGFFSANFHEHPAMLLTLGMFERLDRRRFEVHAFSFGPDKQDDMRRRLTAAFDHFHDISGLDNAQAATFAREKGIDIAVDMMGLTEQARVGIFAYGAAPRQLNFLGFPGTMGADFIDHIIADRIVAPPEDQAHFAEKLAYLPHCYFPNDRGREIAPRRFTRAELGLPEPGFVFCCFNNSYKITPAEYDIWMRLLDRVEGSVLWLLEDNRWAADNLRREALARGVDPARLVFAPRIAPAEHLARHDCADLFLDTFKVNAHTTACDALWTGVPVVTRMGSSMVARVAGSLLHALDLPELVTDSAQAYEDLALALATDPAALAAVRAKLAENRLTKPLFDTELYTRDMERLCERIHAGAE